MRVFRSTDLQRQLGEVQRAANEAPVLFEHHGRPRAVLMSAKEFVRLKRKAGEPVSSESAPRLAVTQRGLPPDPLGYDTSDFMACARQMAEAALAGRNRRAVRAEIAAVERRLGSLASVRHRS